MSEADSPGAFLDKWRARWPEWRMAEVFLQPDERESVVAWFALQQELTDAAWGGSDPRPGEAKLGWWVEELQGWSQGRRRHPLGTILQRQPVPWLQLAVALPSLRASRDRATDFDEALRSVIAHAGAVSGIANALAPAAAPMDAGSIGLQLLAQRAQLAQADAVPLRLRAELGADASPRALATAWARQLLDRWPTSTQGSRAGRMHAALLRQRLRGQAGGRPGGEALPRLHALATSWRAARG